MTIPHRGIYAGTINGVKLVTKNPCKNLVVFTASLADPATTDYAPVLEKNFPPDLLTKIKVFHFGGKADYDKLSLFHKAIMYMVKTAAEKKPAAERNSDENGALTAYKSKIDFVDEQAILPLVEYVKGL